MTDHPQPEKPPAKQDAAKPENTDKSVPASSEPSQPQKLAAPNPVKLPTTDDLGQKSAGMAPTVKPSQPPAPAPQPSPTGASPAVATDSNASAPKPTAPLKDPSTASTRDLQDFSKDATIPSKGTLAERGETKKEETQVSSSGQPKVAQRFSDSTSEVAQSSMQICPTCGHRNRPGVLICDNCGTNLMTGSKTAIGTRDLVKDQAERKADASASGENLLDTSEVKAIEAAGSGTFSEDMVLRIEIEGGTTPMMVYPKQEIIMGRRDPNTGGMPDVDLTTYAGYRMGVSRRHAAIRLQDQQLNLSDLGSSNGTFLNGTRLNAHRPYQVKDGDEIRLGQMVLRVYFQAAKDKK